MTPEGLSYYIDNTLVRTSGHITQIDAIYLLCGNHGYGPAIGTVYFDDIKVKRTKENISLTVTPNDIWAMANQDITFQGRLLNESGDGMGNETIAILDGLKKITTSVITESDGTFEYISSASRSGIYHTTFNFLNNLGDIVAHNNALIDINNSEIVAIFQSVKLKNITTESLNAKLTYQGPLCATDAQMVKIEKEYEIDSNEEIIVIDGSNSEYSPEIIDSTPEFGPPESGSTSIARQLCPLQLGLAEFCGPDPEYPSTQVFSLSAGMLFVGIGLSYDRQSKDFCLSVGPGGNVPYIISGGAAINYCSNGMTLSASGGSGINKGTWSLEVWNREESQGMDAITTFVPLYCPIDPYLTDPLGRHIGINPETKQFVNEIPYAIYTGPAIEPQVISIPFSQLGNFDLKLFGQEEGDYLVQKQVIRNNQIVEQQVVNGRSSQGSSDQFVFVVDTTQISPMFPASLIAIPKIGGVELVWSSVSGAAGYKLYYDSDTTGIPYIGKDAEEGASPINVGNIQKYEINGLDPGITYYFAVTSYNANEIQSAFSNEVSSQISTRIFPETKRIPNDFYLHQNCPNPFNPQTSILFEIPKQEKVEILIVNQLGQVIRHLVNEQMSLGQHQVIWDAKNDNGEPVASGIYFSQMIAGEYRQNIKMLYLK